MSLMPWGRLSPQRPPIHLPGSRFATLRPLLRTRNLHAATPGKSGWRPRSTKYTQMLQQYFETHQNQYDTAEKLRLGFVLGAEHIADLDARGGE